MYIWHDACDWETIWYHEDYELGYATLISVGQFSHLLNEENGLHDL